MKVKAQNKWLATSMLFLYGVTESIRVSLAPAFFQQLTSANYLHYTLEQYGLLFLPFSIAAFLSSLFAGRIIEKKGLFAPFLIAILCDLGSLYFMGMAVLANYSVIYSFIALLVALFLSGIGFGIILTVVTTFFSLIFSKKTEVFITFFYLSLTLGSFILFSTLNLALSHITIFMWILVAFFIAFYFLFNYFEVFPKVFVKEESKLSAKSGWSLFSSLILIGVLESLFFNWSIPYLEQIEVLSVDATNHVYLLFLIFFSLGQVVLGGILYFVSYNFLFLLLPAVLSFMLFVMAQIFAPSDATMFSTIGFFLSCNLPFAVSYVKEMFGVSSRMFGLAVACYTMGYGVGSYFFGVSKLKAALLPRTFLIAAIVALLIFLFNLVSALRVKRVSQ